MACDSLAICSEGVALIKFKGFDSAICAARVIPVLQIIERKCLDGGSGQDGSKFVKVGASLNSVEALTQGRAEAFEEVETDHLLVRRRDNVAIAGKGNRAQDGLHIDNICLVIDSQAQQDVMNGHVGREDTVGEMDIVILGVGQARVDFPQIVVTPKNLDRNGAGVLEGARARGCGKGHDQ